MKVDNIGFVFDVRQVPFESRKPVNFDIYDTGHTYTNKTPTPNDEKDERNFVNFNLKYELNTFNRMHKNIGPENIVKFTEIMRMRPISYRVQCSSLLTDRNIHWPIHLKLKRFCNSVVLYRPVYRSYFR